MRGVPHHPLAECGELQRRQSADDESVDDEFVITSAILFHLQQRGIYDV